MPKATIISQLSVAQNKKMRQVIDYDRGAESGSTPEFWPHTEMKNPAPPAGKELRRLCVIE